MKLLKLSSYYIPENVSSSHLSRDLEDAYLDAGFTIDVYCPTPTRGISAEVREKANASVAVELENADKCATATLDIKKRQGEQLLRRQEICR